MELAGVHLRGAQVLCRAPTWYIAVPLEILATPEQEFSILSLRALTST